MPAGGLGVDSRIFRDDMEECLRAGAYSYEKDFLPVIQAVYGDPRVEAVRHHFSQVTAGLDERVRSCFGKELAVDVVLCLGLCNGAGWAIAAGGAAFWRPRESPAGHRKDFGAGLDEPAGPAGACVPRAGGTFTTASTGSSGRRSPRGRRALCGSCLPKAQPCASNRCWQGTWDFTTRTKTAGKPGARSISWQPCGILTRTFPP